MSPLNGVGGGEQLIRFSVCILLGPQLHLEELITFPRFAFLT